MNKLQAIIKRHHDSLLNDFPGETECSLRASLLKGRILFEMTQLESVEEVREMFEEYCRFVYNNKL